MNKNKEVFHSRDRIFSFGYASLALHDGCDNKLGFAAAFLDYDDSYE